MSEREIAVEVVAAKILVVRGKKVMLDSDLASLYGVETKNLNLQVKRNVLRFPNDFMFQLTKKETLRLQFATSKQGGRRYLPYAFTEQGVAMLSAILSSDRAIQVNIAIMRAFVRMREILLTNKDLATKIETLEFKYKHHDVKFAEYDKHIRAIFEAIKQLMAPEPVPEKPKIGFHSR
jgi:phage regulator Rha-like protein